MLNSIARILSSAGQSDSPLRPTDLYNEGWMLRLLLDHLSDSAVPGHPFSFGRGARWFSEGQLPSPFLAESRRDALCEGWTNADGVVGNVTKSEGRGEIVLTPDATQFVTIEAKMFSGLSPGVSRCASYDQASRYVACIAEAIRRRELRQEQLNNLAFFVVAPEHQIANHVFGERLKKESIYRSVQNRVDMYAGRRDEWFRDHFEPTLNHINVELISWEVALQGLPSHLHDFYDRCLQFNRPRRAKI